MQYPRKGSDAEKRRITVIRVAKAKGIRREGKDNREILLEASWLKLTVGGGSRWKSGELAGMIFTGAQTAQAQRRLNCTYSPAQAPLDSRNQSEQWGFGSTNTDLYRFLYRFGDDSRVKQNYLMEFRPPITKRPFGSCG